MQQNFFYNLSPPEYNSSTVHFITQINFVQVVEPKILLKEHPCVLNNLLKKMSENEEEKMRELLLLCR